jgi:hypothetical protein
MATEPSKEWVGTPLDAVEVDPRGIVPTSPRSAIRWSPSLASSRTSYAIHRSS